MIDLTDFIAATIEATEAWIRDACDFLGISVATCMYAYLAGISGAATEFDYYGGGTR